MKRTLINFKNFFLKENVNREISGLTRERSGYPERSGFSIF